MEPLSVTIATALALGAAAGLKDATEKAVEDAYLALRTLLSSKFSSISVEYLEKLPSSEARRAVVEEDLRLSGADKDPEVLKKSKLLLDAISEHAPQIAETMGVSLEKVKARSLTIEEVVSRGHGVSLREVEIIEDINIKNVKARVKDIKKNVP